MSCAIDYRFLQEMAFGFGTAHEEEMGAQMMNHRLYDLH